MDAVAYQVSFDKEQLALLCANYDRRIDSLGAENKRLNAENAKLQDELEFANDQCERAVLELLDQQGQLKDENAKLREQVDAAHMSRLLTENENESLRELVQDMWFWHYEGHIDSESQEWQMKHIDGVLDRMRELGVEVNDG